MNIEYFISQKLLTAKDRKSSISAPIIKIAIIAIAVGMIMMIIAAATGLGLQQKIREKVVAFNGHITISNFDNNYSEVSLQPLNNNQDFYPNFKNVAGITHIQAVASKAAIIRTATNFEGIIFKGVGKDYKWDVIQDFLVQGRIPDLNNNLDNEILISALLSQRLQLKINDKCNTFFMKVGNNQLPNLRIFKIVGIFNSGFPEFDSKFIIGDIRHVQRINKWNFNQVGNFEVFIEDFSQIKAKGDEIYAEINSNLKSQTIIEKYASIFEWLQLFDFNIMVIIIIMIAVASINMVVAILVLILEKSKMVGILKAIGATNWSIRKIFLYNAASIISKGLIWGNAIGLALILLQKYFGIIKLNPENYYVNEAPIMVDIKIILLINMVTITLILLILLVPSYLITKISPLQAIRHD